MARRARAGGNHPFGAILVNATGEVLIEVENGFMPERDMTGHAERLLATQASKQFEPKFLAACTLYSSAEPCAMCAGAIVRCNGQCLGSRRYRYGKVWRRRRHHLGHHDLKCRNLFVR